jgi:hypothetical protein
MGGIYGAECICNWIECICNGVKCILNRGQSNRGATCAMSENMYI